MYIVSQEQIDNIYNLYNGLEVYSFTGESIIDPALDIGDLLLIDNKYVIYQGSSEYKGKWQANITSEIQSKTQEETTSRKSSQIAINRKLQSQIDQENLKITQVAQEQTETSERLTQAELSIEGLTAQIGDIEDLTNEVSGLKIISLGNCFAGELLELHIYGNNTVFDYLYPSDDLYPADDLYPYGDSRIKVTDEEGNETIYELGVTDVLRQNSEVQDEYVLSNGQAQVIRRVNEDGTTKETEEIEYLGEYMIELAEGTNIIEIVNYSANMKAKYAIQSDYTSVFATKVEMNTKITATAEAITSVVNKKVDEDELGTQIEQNYEHVKYAWNKISDFIQFEVIDETPAIVIKNEFKNLLMALNKTGQHFYDNSGNVIGDIGIVENENKTYLTFQLPLGYDEDLSNGMSWGLNTPNGFVPIFELEGYKITSDSDDIGGRMKMRADLDLEGNALILGNSTISNDTITNAIEQDNLDGLRIYSSDGSVLFTITNSTSITEKNVNILDLLTLFLNAGGNYTLKLGEAMITSDGGVWGYIHDYSQEGKKKNFKKLENALDEVMNTDIYEYNLKTEGDDHKKHVGIVIGENYSYSNKITSLDSEGVEIGVETYSMVSLLWRAVQEQQEQINTLIQEIEKLKEEENGEN